MATSQDFVLLNCLSKCETKHGYGFDFANLKAVLSVWHHFRPNDVEFKTKVSFLNVKYYHIHHCKINFGFDNILKRK